MRQALLLGPGAGLTTISVISLFREATAIGCIVLGIGLLMLATFGALKLQDRAR